MIEWRPVYSPNHLRESMETRHMKCPHCQSEIDLDKHDREQQQFGRAHGRADERQKRQPLVDALEGWLYLLEHRCLIGAKLQDIAKQSRDALAKVKEGK